MSQSTPQNINTNPSNPTLIGQPEVTIHDTTEFITEGDVPQASFIDSQNAQDQYFVNADNVSHEISDFVSRPYRIHSDVWKSGSPLGTVLFSALAVDTFRTSPVWAKLQGFMAFTATFCFRLVVNSQPTQQGQLMMNFRPDETDEDLTDFKFWNKFSDPACELARVSGCPNSTLTIGSTSQSEFRVSYRATVPLCDVSKGEFGKIDLRVLSPLAGPSNAEAVSYSMYMWLEDLKTYATQPYSRAARTQGRALPSAVEAKEKGTISSVADKVGSIASALTVIPGVADIAGPVSWAAKGVSSVASLFGFSKPHDITPSAAVTNNPYKDFAHGAGANACETKLTLNDTAELSVRPLGAVPEDEMNIHYLTKQPTYLLNATWKTSAEVDNTLVSLPMAPQYMVSRSGVIGKKAYTSHTTLSYLALMHRYWRGSINVTFNIVGTKFHSGRLRATFTPSRDWTAPDQHQHTYSKIIDLKDSNTFTLSVPWVKELPVRSTDRVSNAADVEGYLNITVEDKLVANSTCAQYVDIVVFVSGDISFSGPRIPDEHVANGVTFASLPPPPAEAPRAAKTQGFTADLASDQVAVMNMVPDEVKPTPQQEQRALEVTVGDPEPSLRTLAKRMAYNGVFTIKEKNKDIREHLVLPSNQLQGELAATITNDTVATYGDFIDWVAALYRFRAGGIRYCIYGDLPKPENTLIKFCPLDGTNIIIPAFEVTPAGIGTFKATIARFMQMLNYVTVPYAKNNYGIQISVPYYHDRPALTNARWFIPNPLPITTKIGTGYNPVSTCDSYVAISNLARDDTDLTKNRLFVFRAAADDFNCGFFTGPPITYRNIP